MTEIFMSNPLNDAALDQLFRDARSQNGWRDEPVSDAQILALYELLKWGPTTANTCPARFVFVKSDEAKERLKPHLTEGNVEKSMTAPVVAIVAHDVEFFEKIPQLFPHNPGAKDWFNWSEDHAHTTAFRNGTLQGAYLLLAARSLGLDCGPMSGFDNEGVDKEFFDGTTWKSNFICGIGYGEPSKVFDRLPRLSFDEACQLL